jgi:hypothetical protein
MTCTLTDGHDCANVSAANSALRQHLDRACDERDAALAREKTTIEEGQRLAAEVANLRDEVVSWRKGVEDANRIGQRERADADTLRHVAETVSTRAHDLADRVQALEACRFLLERKLAQAQRWIRDAAETRERDAKPFPVVFDHACAECIPHGEIVKPGFRCAVHEARAAAPATTTEEQRHA